MNRTLLVNFKRYGDVYSLGHLIASLKKRDPNASVSLLVYKEFEQAAKSLAGVEEVFSFDRKKIITYLKSSIFSDGFALNELDLTFQKISSQDWDTIFNTSNDKVACHITSALSQNTKDYIGVKFSNLGRPQPSSDWDMVFNDILTSYKNTPISFNDCFHLMAGTSQDLSSEKVILNPKYLEEAKKNIEYLRKTYATEENTPKVIAIQLKSSNSAKDIEKEELVTLLKELYLNTSKTLPILLVAPTQVEKDYAASINAEFDNKLVTVETDFSALAPVIQCIDILITPDTVTKHIADLLNVRTIEVSKGPSPFLKQGTNNPNSVVISNLVSKRYFEKENEAKIKSSDILNVLNALLGKTSYSSVHLSDGIGVYKRIKDELGFRTELQNSSSKEDGIELSRLLARNIIASIFDVDYSTSNYGNFNNVESDLFHKWISMEKSSITDLSKTLLGTLRALLQTKENSSKRNSFLASLEQLLSLAKQDTVAAIPTLIFQAKLESLTSTTMDESIKDVEGLLYELKADIQIIFNTIKSVDLYFLEVRKENFMTKPTSARDHLREAH